MLLNYIVWNVSPDIFKISENVPIVGGFTLRWYGLLFATGFVLGYLILQKILKKEGIDHLINDVKTLGITVDILYNNAAIMRPYRHDIWSHTYEDWLQTYHVNVVAMYKLCSAFLPAMIANGFGRVINTTSRIMNQPELAPYGASKWAVDKLSMDIAFSLENTNVRLNYFDPGWLKTDMGGENAEHPVEDVLPGALMPALVEDDGPNGQFFSAVDYIGKEIPLFRV
jgi:NAD(P)-dependent dehydrogenase (short-subunit alcohol dehydrogenase family)